MTTAIGEFQMVGSIGARRICRSTSCSSSNMGSSSSFLIGSSVLCREGNSCIRMNPLSDSLNAIRFHTPLMIETRYAPVLVSRPWRQKRYNGTVEGFAVLPGSSTRTWVFGFPQEYSDTSRVSSVGLCSSSDLSAVLFRKLSLMSPPRLCGTKD